MVFNKEKRLEYLGFNDFWFSVIGILIISLVTNYLFNTEFEALSLIELVVSWAVSLLFTIIDWLINRSIMIFLRKKISSFSQ